MSIKRFYKTLYVISILLFNMVIIENNIYSLNKIIISVPDQVRVSKDELEKRKKLFIDLQNKVVVNLKRTNSLSSISKFLTVDFYFTNQYYRSLPDEEHCEKGPEVDNNYSCHSIEESVLKKIDKYVNIKNIIYVFENGTVEMSESMAWCYLPKYDALKYPYIDYTYNESKGRWFISVIRYELLRD